MLSGISNIDIGQQNIDFIHQYLAQEGLKITAEDMVGNYPRKILYFPCSGRVKLKKLQTTSIQRVAAEENVYLENMQRQPVASSIDLF